ncbi:uncharacterized protein LOC129605555 [Condylostylus longicornis]|uniref:uncharacterized protein LOC129605555 n=1 Tax=Condylostylus longicornis TaxID=2530218 RepID=UPI00244DC501|nr:uncharacterized protein LOC129605555 [Condylostylus longicornis]
MEIPKLLNKDFFKKSIENGLKISNVIINELDISAGFSGGENYCSQIFRACIKYNHNNKSNNISLIIKYMDLSGEKIFLEELEVYQREKKMYFEVIPELEKILGGNVKLSPKCFYAVNEPVTTIVFEDMSQQGYEVSDRINGLDEIHIKILLEKIAKFHAASMILAEKDPNLMKSFHRGMFHSMDCLAKDTVFIGNLDYLADTVDKKWSDFDAIANKIRNIKKKFYDVALKTVELKESTIAVLNHGDLWVNNMMFKKCNNTVTDVALIDLQLSYYGSLGIDLHYFMNTSIPTEILKTKRYELLRFYFGHLKNTLKILNYKKIPTWEEFKNEIHSTEFYGFFAYEAILPVICLDKEASKDNSFETFTDEKKSLENREKVINSKRFIEMSKYSLDRFDELGILDI